MFITQLTFKRVDAHHRFCFGTLYWRKHALVGKGSTTDEAEPFLLSQPLPLRDLPSPVPRSVYKYVLSICYVSDTWRGTGATAVGKRATSLGELMFPRPGKANHFYCERFGALTEISTQRLPNHKSPFSSHFYSWLLESMEDSHLNLLMPWWLQNAGFVTPLFLRIY